MEIGMLWYDDTKRPLDEKVARAVEHYKNKYGAIPTVCYVNPSTVRDGPETAGGVQLRSARNVLVDHFWLGVGDTAGRNGSANGNGHGAPAGNGRSAGRRRARRAGASKSGRARASEPAPQGQA